jgi:hypothetical protein
MVRIASLGTPACSIFCSTAFIATAFCFCASAEFFERDSAAIITNARSGRAFRIACPRVTIDGCSGDTIGGWVWAKAGEANAEMRSAAGMSFIP